MEHLSGIISQLEAQRNMIDRIVGNLRSFGQNLTTQIGATPTQEEAQAPAQTAAPVKRRMSAAARRNIAAAQKKRWDTQRAQQAQAAGQTDIQAQRQAEGKNRRKSNRAKIAATGKQQQAAQQA